MSTAQSDTTKTIITEDNLGDYFTLLKPKVMSLVIFTGFAGMWLAPNFAQTHPLLIAVAILALSVGAGASGAINMWFDRDIDAVMNRTKERPIPMGRINPDEALTYGIVLSIFSVMLMGVALNWVAAGILAFANLFYVLIYTMWLKRSTPQNIVIGGAAGAFPPIIGWAAITGDITLYPVILFAVIFIWTPPHFWALSLFANEDYKRAKIPMMTVTAGAHKTKIQMIIYTLVLLPVTLAPWALGYASQYYGFTAGILSTLFILSALKVYKSDEADTTFRDAKIMFGYSVFYLFALFLALMLL